MAGKICNFYGKPGGCRRGSSCTFRHVDAGNHVGAGRGSTSSPTQASLKAGPNTFGTRIGVPPGVCQFFWQKGDCSRGFQCRARHVLDPARESASSTSSAAVAPSIPAELAPFLTDAGLARMHDMSTDALFNNHEKPKSPIDVHNFLKKFLYDSYRFRTSLDVYSFLRLIVDASTNNSLWTSEDGQLLLNAIAKDNGYARMCDIFAWQEVSSKAGAQRDILSFQRGYIPLLQYLSSDFVVRTPLSHLANALYSLLIENIVRFANNIEKCMEELVAARSFKDPSSPSGKELSGIQIFGSLSMVLLQILTRFKNVTVKETRLRPLVLNIHRWLQIWITGVSATPPTFPDAISQQSTQMRGQYIDLIAAKVDQLVSIVDREQSKLDRATRPPQKPKVRYTVDGILAALHNTYVGPGYLRPEGPRHDNDFVNITDIRIAPTHDELVSKAPPFLPANRYGAPHPHEQSSAELLLDVQFRLLREELIASLRTSVQAVRNDLAATGRRQTQLSAVMDRRGGKYRGTSQEGETLMFNLYTGAQFVTIAPDWRGLSVTISVDTPPGRARAPEARSRAAFWEGSSGKRLLSGGLVALIWRRRSEVEVHLGVISSSLSEHVDSSKGDANRISVRVTFFDPSIELRILQDLHAPAAERDGLKFLVEATVMFESIRPFLEALRVEPTTLPFARYLVHQPDETLRLLTVDPPRYALSRGFAFELASLFPDDSVDSLRLVPTDSHSIANARERLRSGSRLDPSQADAIVDALTREVALCQGPPGTGKSYTGVQLIRVLLANRAVPILMIAFTNHALDHMLSSVLEAGITKKIVRLGSRSSDESIAQFSLENMEKIAGRSRLDRAFSGLYYKLKKSEEAVKVFMKDYLKTSVESASILNFLDVFYLEQYESLMSPPPWIQLLYKTSTTDDQWRRVGRHGKSEEIDDSLYAFWLSGGDLEFLQAAHAIQASRSAAVHFGPVHSSANVFLALSQDNTLIGEFEDVESVPESAEVSSDDESDDELPPEERWRLVVNQPVGPPPMNNQNIVSAVPTTDQEPAPLPYKPPHYDADSFVNGLRPDDIADLDLFFAHFGMEQIPLPSTSKRSLDALLDHGDIWTLSGVERERLHKQWSTETRQHLQEAQVLEFEMLREKHRAALDKYNESKSAARSELLHGVDIIGCTTTGAAKLASLLKAVGPRIMLVEEAGQVLEAHVLGSLVPSIQHLILIGDPLQLRPTIENYSLSMDHKIGGLIYKFDMSLMERLSSSGLSMSQINVQRRMRPQVSNLIRTYLYPNLEDHELVKQHPDVRGMAKNVFFLTHNHKENTGEDESVSKFNQFEVDMVVDLVMHLLRQGLYSAEGDIVVLCAYLGQLAKMRDAFSDKVAVVIDERDQQQLADHEGENEDEGGPMQQLSATIDHVKVSRRVRLRTIDNYQGEEAKIVILTLVRNSGGSDEEAGFAGKGRVNVGFLKSENRTNVALSRAREGLFILGNGPDLASRSEMWHSVIGELENDNCVGEAFPVVCAQHRDEIHYVSKPGQLPRIAPDGGCLRQCNARLKCGHACPYKCHSDDPNHVSVRCEQSCTKLCVRGHPCTKPCAEDCGKCVTRIAEVQLPCGHTKGHIACYQLDDLDNVSCDVIVRKKLPKCEHEADVTCSTPAADVLCRKACSGIMKCCGRPCTANCHECQHLNHAEGDTTGVTLRQVHKEHPCEKTLACGHLCGKACSEDHRCTKQCQKACRQVCIHTACKNYCSTPCAPCQEPCTWACPHHKCPVPCGSVCARLPCDKRCEKLLQCGHRCPSLCGEDCSIQVCPYCASEEVANSTVVDVILGLTLGDIDPDAETIDNLLITIPLCGHVFTVETLDGICDMNVYYERAEDDSKWTGLKAPSPDPIKPPACPTCRAAITSPRYGRIFKRADLDILENNVIFAMSDSLETVGGRIQQVSTPNMKERMEAAAAVLRPNLRATLPPSNGKERRAKQKVLNEKRKVPLPFPSIDPKDKLHGIPSSEVQPWRNIVSVLFTAYRDARHTASQRSAHTHAWEASFGYLYKQEMENAVQDPSHAPRNPQQHAMRMARMNVGQPQPRADMRFGVEAFWLTINIRLMLFDLAKAWADKLGANSAYDRRLWDEYLTFLLKTCKQDADIALQITEDSDSYRQSVRTHLLLLRIDLEMFRFNQDASRRTSRTFGLEARQELADRAQVHHGETEVKVKDIVEEHMNRSRASRGQEKQWIWENFEVPSQMFLQEWKNLEASLRRDTFYEEMSLQEMTDVVKALNFSHSGHFYRCPNGHTFVITECGGAMQSSQCPECGEVIGGNNHNLHSTNTRASEYEELAREQGAQQSPWAWGQ